MNLSIFSTRQISSPLECQRSLIGPWYSRGESSTLSPAPLQLFTTTDMHKGFGFAAGRTGRRQWPGVSTSWHCDDLWLEERRPEAAQPISRSKWGQLWAAGSAFVPKWHNVEWICGSNDMSLLCIEARAGSTGTQPVLSHGPLPLDSCSAIAILKF